MDLLSNIENMIIMAIATNNNFLDSVPGQGLIRMSKDGGTLLAIISSVLTICLVIVLAIKKSAAETNESGSSKGYNKSILIVLGCGIFALIVGVIFAVIGSYFGVNIQV